ncbi:hypothetical protein Aperf_G00000125024 [Anoplocephala perfoliata]
MSRIYGWLPDPIDEFATGALVKCSGVTADDTINLGTIRYYDTDYKFSANAPAMGPGKLTNGSFHSMYFPYTAQVAYLQPLVHGFDTARACFVLKMGRIYSWLPDPIDEFATGALVKCSGVTADDTINLGTIRYYDTDYKFSANAPAMGPGKLTNGSFHSMYFPYTAQVAYLQPLVFVMFDGVKRNTYIRVRCWLIAKNIKVDFERGEGSTQFAIIYD